MSKRTSKQQKPARRPVDRSTTLVIPPEPGAAWEVEEEGETRAAMALAVAIAAAVAATLPAAPATTTASVGPTTETTTVGTTTIAATAAASPVTTAVSTSVKRAVVEPAPAPVDEQADLSPAEVIARPEGPVGQAPAAPAQEEATPEEVQAITGALPAAARAAALANAALGWWRERLVTPVSSLVGRMLHAPDQATRGVRRHEARRLPFELHLCMAAGSVRVAPSGPIDDLAVFQRTTVSAYHDVEYLVRLDPKDAGTERYEAFGLFRLRESEASPLADLRDLTHVWEGLARDLELSALPRCRPLLRDAGRPERAEEGASWLRVVAGGRPFQTVKGRRVTLAEVIDWLRAELAPAEKIAWLEEAFTTEPEPGQIVHRYYLDGRRKAWLVRHHWAKGKLLFAARTSAEAKRLCELESAGFTRSGSARRGASGTAARPRSGRSATRRRPGNSGTAARP